MKNIKIIILISLFLLSAEVYSQVTFQGTVANQIVTDTEVSFDVFFTRTGSNDLYIGNADFTFNFNSANFTNPVFEYIDETGALKNSNGTATTSYNENIATDILPGNVLVININQPVFSNQTQFNSRIARVDATPNAHKLGRFRITGITNAAGTLNLQWKTSVPGVNSNMQTLGTTNPWISSAAAGTYVNPGNIALPVELVSFTSRIIKNSVELNWKTAAEINNSAFEVERKEVSGEWRKISSVHGAGTTNEEKVYSFTDMRLTTGRYKYRLKQVDFNGNYEYLNLASEVEVGVPDKFVLSQNYPNPFNPTTKIDYDLPADAKVSLKIYDMTGKEISNLVNESQSAGYYTVSFNASGFASGIYFYQLNAQSINKNFVKTLKMVIVK